MKSKRAVPPDAPRSFYVARCPSCGVARAAVEAGPGDAHGRSMLEGGLYVVTQEAGPVSFRPHAPECA